MPFKDHFSRDSAAYHRFRPRYPEGLFRHLASLTDRHDVAWDCATGSGQAALSKRMQRAWGTATRREVQWPIALRVGRAE